MKIESEMIGKGKSIILLHGFPLSRKMRQRLRGTSKHKSLTHEIPDVSLPVYLIFDKLDSITTGQTALGLNQHISNLKLFLSETPGTVLNME